MGFEVQPKKIYYAKFRNLFIKMHNLAIFGLLSPLLYLLKVETTVPISLGSHDRFPSGFLEWKVKTLQVIILQECA